MKRGGDVGVLEGQAVVAISRNRAICEPRFMKRFIEEIAGAISRKHSASPVRAMGRGSKAQYEQFRLRVTESGNGSSPIVAMKECAALFSCHLLTIANQARAFPAVHDLMV